MPLTTVVEDDTPRENGGYLIIPKRGGGVGVEEYSHFLLDMMWNTFPMNQLDGVRSGHLLTAAYLEGYKMLYIPRGLYTLMYRAFMLSHDYGDTEQALKSATALVDGYIAMNSVAEPAQQHPLWRTILGVAMEHAQHFAHFNAWAVMQLTRPGRSNKYAVLHLEVDKLNEFRDMGLRYFGERFFRMVADHHTLGYREQQKIVKLIRLEGCNPAFTFITRFGSSICYPTMKEESSGAVGAAAFSQSFGSGLFAGLHGDTHACTLLSIKKNRCFLVPINIENYRNDSGYACGFYIPPIPMRVQQYAGMQELWHPRSKVYNRKAVPLEQQQVSGINDYGLQAITGGGVTARDIKPLLYKGGVPLSDKQIKQNSEIFRRYVEKNLIEL